ncbi:MAG: hypothetical protein HUJ68_08210 [Clostridia bacterium]|nr:hypothetical protein [Clostridia bacterium]
MNNLFFIKITHIFANKIEIDDIYIKVNKIGIKMDKMLELLKEQEAQLLKEQQNHLYEGKIKLSPKIDVEECLRNGGITADDYRKTHQ